MRYQLPTGRACIDDSGAYKIPGNIKELEEALREALTELLSLVGEGLPKTDSQDLFESDDLDSISVEDEDYE